MKRNEIEQNTRPDTTFEGMVKDSMREHVNSRVMTSLRVDEGKVLVSEWREYLKLSRAEVAERFGLPQAVFDRIEKTGAKLRQNTIVNLAEILGLHPEGLLRG